MIIEKNFKTKAINNKNISKKYKSIEIIVPFENLLKDPKKYLKKICKIINSRIDKFALKSLKKNNVPRKYNLDKEKLITLKLLRNKIRPKYFDKLINLEKLYEKNILSRF